MDQQNFALSRVPVNIEDEMKRSYMDYAMSVIIGRALPDVRDGLKPAHRRVLYGMRLMGLVEQPGLPQVRQDRRRGDGQLPSPRRRVDLRHAGAPRAGLQHALSPGRRPGELRLGRRRLRRGHALHRGAAEGPGRRPDGGSRQGDRRLRPELRRDHRRADRPAGAVPEPARERLDRHRRRHGDEHPAAQPGRDRRRAGLADPSSRPACATRARRPPTREEKQRRGPRAGPRPRLPDRRLDHRPARDLRGVHDGPRIAHAPREDGVRGSQGRSHGDRRHRDPVPGQQGEAAREDRRARAREDHRGHLGSARRVRPPGHADRHRAEARRGRAGRAQQPAQAHPAAVDVRRDHARDRRGPPARAAAARHARVLHRVPPRRRPPPDRVRAAQGRGARAHPRRLQDRARQHRRGHRADQGVAEHGRRARGLDDDVRAERAPVAGHPRDAAAAADRARAAEDPRRARRTASARSSACARSSAATACCSRSS